MRGRERLFALSGGVIGAAVTYGAVWLSSGHTRAAPRAAPSGSRTARDRGSDDDDGGASADPAMVANAHLVESLQECSQRLSLLADDESRIEEQLQAEQRAEADASLAARARRLARRDPSPDDWKQMASAGTIRYRLPCASFDPAPSALDSLGLEAGDVPVIQSAFAAARAAAWTQVRPLCAVAVGSLATADQLGLEACPQVILNAERATDPAAAARAMRAVGAVKAGLADPSTIPTGDPVGATFLAMTGVAKDAEDRLGSVMGPDDARSVVYGSGSCGRTAQFTSPGG